VIARVFIRRFQKPTGGRTSFTTATKLKVLLCPTETATPISNGGSPSNNVADAAPRSYFINGWNDYFNDTLSAGDFANYMNGIYPTGLKESLIAHASDTIILGEKASDQGDFYMDLLENGGNDAAGAFFFI
jgi:hypothetical protein